MESSAKYQSIVLMGKTGCGKGTQAHLLADALGYRIFSTGEKTREVSTQNTPLGKQIYKIGISGWIPEWLATYFMVKAILEEYPDEGIVYESIARKPREAGYLHEIHEMTGRSYIVVHLEVDDDTVIARMRERNRDASDSEENIKNRLAAFAEETTQSLDFFRGKGKVVSIDASQKPQKVFEDIMSHIN